MYIRNTNSSTNTTHPTMDVAYEQAYYTNRQSDTSGVNKFKIGATNETLTAVWRAVDQTVKITPNNANGNYKVTATNLFDKNDMLTANSKIIARTATAWNGASYIGEDSTHTISGWIRVVPGATYKITGATEAGMVEWSKGTKAKTSYFYTVETQATSYSNNTAFTAPTSFTNTSGNTASVTYAYMRFHFKTSDLNNIALSMTDSSSYTNTQTLYFPNNASISVVATPNTGFTAGVTKSSGLGTLTTSTSGSVVTGNLANIAGNASTTNLAVTFTEKTATLTYNANGHGTAPSNVTMKYTTATNAASAITATNYRFDGWNTKADGTGTAYAAGAQVKATNVIPNAITLYAQWTYNATPSISLTDYNTFSYSGAGAKAYYVSTSATAPTAGTAQTGFELDKWTTATSTGDLTLTEGQTYYVFIEDTNATTGKVSINKVSIAVRTVTRSIGTGSGLTVKYTNSSGANVTFSSNKANMFNGTVIYVSATASTGYQNPVLKQDNASATNSTTYTITANTTFTSSASEKTATLTYNANGHGTAPANVTMKYTTATNAASAITATNYRFDGWNTKADGTGTAYAAGTQVKAANAIPSAITLYAQWTYNATPSISLTDYNTFSYSGAGAKSYYVSTSATAPTAGTAQTGFELNKWTTATSTGDLTLTEGQTYYVFIEDTNATTGKVSINKASIVVRTVTRSIGTGSGLTVKYTNSSGANVTFSSNKSNMFNGTVIYVSATASTGYENPVLKKDNASATNSTTYTITANTTFASSVSPKTDTAYKVNHYVHDLGANTYTLESTDNKTGTTDSELTLANLKKTIVGFTYVDGFADIGNTTKPTSGAVTTTTIKPDGSRVINLYYRRNYLYIQYDMNGGTLNTTGNYGTSGSLITTSSTGTSTKFFRGVYGGVVGGVTNSNTYETDNTGLHNYNNSSAINILKDGYLAQIGEEWNTKADGTGTSYNHATGTYQANNFGGIDLSTGDKTVTVYVNWVASNYGEYNGTTLTKYYDTLANATSNATSGRTIKALVGVTETTAPSVPSGKTLVFDLNGKTTTLNGVYLTNGGTLDIYNSSSTEGILQGSGTYIVRNQGTFTTNNASSTNKTTLKGTSTAKGARVLLNDAGKTATLNTNTYLTYTQATTGDRYVVTTNGNLTIAGANITNKELSDTASWDRGVQNGNSNAKIIITSGTIDTSGTAVIASQVTENDTANTAIEISGGTISSTSAPTIYNNHTKNIVTISGGDISSGSSYGALNNNTGTLNITGGNISSTSSNAVRNNSTGTTDITGGTITSTSGDAVLNNNTGTINITGGSITANAKAGINVTKGNVNITGGTITGYTYGVWQHGTNETVFTMGTDDSTVTSSETAKPEVTATKASAGIGVHKGAGTFNFYDGVVKGASGKSIDATVSDTPDGYGVYKSTESNVETAILTKEYTATFYYYNGSAITSKAITKESATDGKATITIPTEVIESDGSYGGSYVGLSASTGNMTQAVAPTATTIEISSNKSYYALYRTEVTIYRPSAENTITTQQYYRNQWLTSTSAISNPVLSQSTTGTSNQNPTMVSGYTFKELRTEVADGGTAYSVANAAKTEITTFYARETKDVTVTATFCYNSNTTSGSLTAVSTTADGVATNTLHCTSTSAVTIVKTTKTAVTIPTEVTGSIGQYNTPYHGLATELNSMTATVAKSATTVSITANKTYYAIYGGGETTGGTGYVTSEVTVYRPNNEKSCVIQQYYRNEFFTSTSTMNAVLSTNTTGTLNKDPTMVSGYTFLELRTGTLATGEAYTVANAAKTDITTFYVRETKDVTATIWYNSNISSGGLTATSKDASATNILSCTNTTSAHLIYGDITIPSQVMGSLGKYNAKYAGLASEVGTMTNAKDAITTPITSSITKMKLAENKTFYAIYSRSVSIYRPTSTTVVGKYTAYRNEYFTSTSAMEAKLGNSATATSDITSISGIFGILAGFNTAVNTNSNTYATIASLRNSSSTTVYARTTTSTNITFYSGVENATTNKVTQTKTYYCKTVSETNVVNGTITTPTPASVSDWTPLGWRNDTTAGNKEFNSATSITPTVTTYYAVYSRTLTISYNGNNATSGSVNNTTKTIYLNAHSTQTSNQQVTLSDNTDGFVKTGYTFCKWAEGSATGTQYSAGESYTAGLAYNASTFGKTMYAIWTPNTYTVEYNSNGGTGTMDNQLFTYDVNQALTSNAFTKTGYTFTGWSISSSDKCVIYDDTEYWYNNTDGTDYATLKEFQIPAPFASGDVYQLELDAKGSGTLSNYFYGFEGYLQVASWTNSNGQTDTNSDGNNTIPISSNYTHYSVRFTLGSSGDGSITKRLLFRTQIGCNAAIKNVRFYKVTADSTAYVNGQTVKNLATSGTVNLYAIWKANTYTISYDKNGGSGTTMTNTIATYDELTTISANTYTKTGYTFAGWTTKSDGTDDGYRWTGWSGTWKYVDGQYGIASGKLQLYARWTANTYKVKFNSNGGTGTMADQTFAYDEYKGLSGNTFTRTGYKFVGWSTATNGKSIIYDNAEQSYNNTSGTSYATLRQYEIPAPFASGDVYQLELDAKGSGTLSNYFYGFDGYLQVASWTNSKGQNGTKTDGHNDIPITSSYAHYSVTFTLGSTGDGSINKLLLFRTQAGCNATIKNVRFYKVTSSSHAYIDGHGVRNLTATNGGTVNLYAIWQPTYYFVNAPYKYSNTLSEAVSTAKSGATITVLVDGITDASSPTANKNLTLNLNGKTLTVSREFNITDKTTTIKGTGTLYKTQGGSTRKLFNCTSSGSISIKDAIIRSEGASIFMNDSCTGTVNIDNSSVYSSVAGTIQSYDSDITINNSTIAQGACNKHAIYIEGHTKTINVTISGNSVIFNNADGDNDGGVNGGTLVYDAEGDMNPKSAICIYTKGIVTATGTSYVIGHVGPSIDLFAGCKVYFTESSSAYSFNDYCVKCKGAGCTISVNTKGYLYAGGDYAIYGHNDPSMTLAKGHFVSRTNKYMTRNNGTNNYPGGDTAGNRYFVYASGFDSTTRKAIISTRALTGCYYLERGSFN